MADEHDSKKLDPLEWAMQRAAEAAKRLDAKRAETPQQLFLPGMDEVMRAMPNHIARSSLFAPVARGRRKMHDGTLLQSRGDVEIRYSGKQLDEAQADVWMQAMREAQRQPLGTPVLINRAEFLRSIGRAESGQNYQWLHRTVNHPRLKPPALAGGGLLLLLDTRTSRAWRNAGRSRWIRLQIWPWRAAWHATRRTPHAIAACGPG
jgi:hypothetical protein